MIRMADLDPEDILVSFDVKSLFSRIPVEEALEVIRVQLQQDDKLEHRTTMNTDDICGLIKLYLGTTYFLFGGVFYEQLQGTAMGSPLSPVVANLYGVFLNNSLYLLYSHRTQNVETLCDDTFVIWPHGDHQLESILIHLNSL